MSSLPFVACSESFRCFSSLPICTRPCICELEKEGQHIVVGISRGAAHSISSRTFLTFSGKSLNLVDLIKNFENLNIISTCHDTAP